ncbi:2-oxoglutarate dehydrogenase E1 component [Rhizosphaericola mali]|uniref:oxoglutarate dehydrogenase (succinyl-transferring) n=1 Tax=Rhizosphaericola mali TaxID=2545455 RepID=A0A5P2G2I8_9BACT|nr:2-oxoglutarate dehydrogenase E1 component [Rhizosphaericola mali]QES90016.1 2-oxoglutarate dehydrogenase E1 component [Rhizosphaericola mali]
MKDFSYITNSHPAYIESLYRDYSKDPQSVDPELKKFFDGFDYAVENNEGGGDIDSDHLAKEFNVFRLIEGYRKKGHLLSSTNPIRPRKDRHANLDLNYYDLADTDLKSTFLAGKFIGLPNATLEQIVAKLKKSYCGNVGFEFNTLTDEVEIAWLLDAIDNRFHIELNLEIRKRVLEKINQGVIFEKFLQTKYIGQKRFSLEGGEALIPSLDTIITKAAIDGSKEVVIGMAHRGRLNVLANILGKTYEQIFSEFEGIVPADNSQGSGDVKYHLGFRSEVTTPDGNKVNLQLSPNPSHLEVVDPVTLGFTRSKANVLYNGDFNSIVPILIHGDAAQSGQGIIYEVAQMSALAGFEVGGTIHVTVNNQIGFTTDFDDARSSDYCTSVASVTKSPVFHVNGDDLEAVVKVSRLAAEYRSTFHKDIFIDILCYRRHGHNEGDEPKFTQPSLYSLIDKHKDPREEYIAYLNRIGDQTVANLANEMEKKFWEDLQTRLDEVRQHPNPYTLQAPEEWWAKLRFSKPEDFDQSPETGIPSEEVKSLVEKLMSWPESFSPLRKVKKLLNDKKALFDADTKIDWGTAELLAYSSILVEGKDVRLSGEDVKRGTFSHRHAILYDENTNEQYNRLAHFSDGQGKFRCVNSLLSEYGVLGYEYGYAIGNPNVLTIWEAQYGDFANGAQMVIDQYITSGEAKWGTMNGLVMLLPHGYEGSGPDHSNARPERYLQMAAEYNIFVTNITTAANFFHALRRQLALPFRKPLINMSPKANLRHPDSYSLLEEFTKGSFQEVIDDVRNPEASGVKKVLLCSGKIYFDLEERQKEAQDSSIAIVRLEQYFPLPEKQLKTLHEKYVNAVWYWVQEEPLNMGAASFLKLHLEPLFPFGIISRKATASTATGYAKVHKQEQAEVIDTAFKI